jgi:hypothetical protein
MSRLLPSHLKSVLFLATRPLPKIHCFPKFSHSTASTNRTPGHSHQNFRHRSRQPAPENQVWPTESHILVVDLEATCWATGNPPQGQYNEIIEIGWALLNLEARPPTIEQNGTYLVKPIRSEVSTFCTELTTITPQLLDAEGMTLEEAYNKLQEEHDSKSYSWARRVIPLRNSTYELTLD